MSKRRILIINETYGERSPESFYAICKLAIEQGISANGVRHLAVQGVLPEPFAETYDRFVDEYHHLRQADEQGAYRLLDDVAAQAGLRT